MAAFTLHPDVLDARLFEILMYGQETVMRAVLFPHSHPKKYELLVDLRIDWFAVVVLCEIEVGNRGAEGTEETNRARCPRPRRNACAPPIERPAKAPWS